MLLGRHLNKYYVKYLWLYLLGIVGLVAVDYFQLLIPEYLGRLVDLVGVSVNSAALSEIVIGVITVALIMFLGRILWRLTIFSASHKTEADLRREMFLKSERLSQRYYHENKVGTVMAWFTTDLETIEEYLGWGTVMLFDAVFLSLLVIVRMLRLDWVLALILFVPLILIVLWGALVEKFMALRWTERQREFDKLYDFSQESFTGIRVIKAFLKETHEIKEFAKIAKRNKEANIAYVKYSVFFDVMISLIIAVILAILLGVGGFFAYRFITGAPVVLFGHAVELTAGNLITFIGYFDSMIWPMMALGQIVSMRSRAKASLKRISDFMNTEEEIRNRQGAVPLENAKGEITFHSFSFTYPGSTAPVLKNVTFTVNAGETIGVVGKVGSGKTTLMSALLRLYNLEEGTVFLDGKEIMSLTLESVRRSVAFVPQEAFLFSDSIENNILFGRGESTREEVVRSAEFACVARDIEGFQNGYLTLSGERGVTLSGGQKQRIALARAHLLNAPILILDDSVSAVDVKTEEEILAHIAEERKGKTTVVIASRVSTVSHMNRILVLNDGTVEAFDTHENLMKNSPVYRKMVYLQALKKEVEGGAV